MEIKINNQLKKVSNDSLLSLVEELLGDKTKGVAIAVNQAVVPKSEWKNTKLKEQDDVMIIKATQGG